MIWCRQETLLVRIFNTTFKRLREKNIPQKDRAERHELKSRFCAIHSSFLLLFFRREEKRGKE